LRLPSGPDPLDDLLVHLGDPMPNRTGPSASIDAACIPSRKRGRGGVSSTFTKLTDGVQSPREGGRHGRLRPPRVSLAPGSAARRSRAVRGWWATGTAGPRL